MVGLYLKEWRQLRHLTRHELADALGTSLGRIHDLETGRARSVSMDLIGGLCRAFNCKPGDLFVDPTIPPPPATRLPGGKVKALLLSALKGAVRMAVRATVEIILGGMRAGLLRSAA